MKNAKFIWAFFALITLNACTVNKDIEYVTVKHPKVLSITNNQVVLQADALFYNPNSIGVNIKSSNIDIFNESRLLGNASTNEVNVIAKDTFSIPLLAKIPLKNLIDNKESLLAGVLSALNKKSVDLNFKGTIALDVMGINYNYNLDENISYKLK